MSNTEKLLEKMKNQPRGIKVSEAEKVLKEYGYKFIRQKGSHRHYRNEIGDVITLKNENPLKISYINEILDRIYQKKKGEPNI